MAFLKKAIEIAASRGLTQFHLLAEKNLLAEERRVVKGCYPFFF